MILDTSATGHISYDIASFNSCKTIIHIHVSLPDGSQAITSMSNSVALSPILTLHNVLYIPSFHVNLLYITKLVNSNDFRVYFNANSCKILQNHSKEIIGITSLQKGLYVLDSIINSQVYYYIAQSSCNLWHLRSSHIFNIGLQNISKAFSFMPYENNIFPCDSCHFGKQKKFPFPHSTTITPAPFKKLHVDMWGPFSTISILGHKYFFTLVDDYTIYTWVIFLKTKYQTKTGLIQFVAYIENQFKTSLKFLRSDNGIKFIALSEFFLSKGIVHQKNYIETP